jgi:WD40 repeat protein
MKGIIIFILLIIVSLKAECGLILCFDAKEKKYKLTEDRKYLVEIDKRIIRIFNHINQKFLYEISDIKDEIIQTELSPDDRKILVVQRNYSVNLYDLSTGKLLQVFLGNTADINSAVFSPDGRLVITASSDSTACIYEVSTGKLLHILAGHTVWFNSAVFSPDGKLAITASSDNTARIYEVSTGKLLHILAGHTDWVNSAVFSPDGKQLMSTSDKETLIWNAEKGNILGKINHDLFHGKAIFSTDGKKLILCDDKFIYLHNSDNLLLIKEISQDPDRPNGHRKIINQIRITPSNILTLLDCNNDCISWDLNSNSKLFEGLFFTNEANFTYDLKIGLFSEYSFTDKYVKYNRFFYPLLESRRRIFLISCAADIYNPPLFNLLNCKSDAEKVIHYFDKAKNLENQIADLKQIIKISDENLKLYYRNKLDSIQLLLSKEPILVIQRLYDYNLSKSSIISAFNDVKNQLQDDDAFVFHFTGMGDKIKNSELSTLFFSSDTSNFTANDLFQLSEIINGNNQLFLLDACQDNFVNQFKSEILNNKINSQLINRNRIVLAIKNIAVDNYKGTGGGALTYAFINNIAPFNQVFSYNNREKNEYDYNLYNGTKELREDKSLNFEVFRESDFYDVKFKEKNNKRGVILTSDENKEVEKPNTISKGETLSVVVGINAYLKLTPLTNPLIDAEKISTILKEKYGHKVILLKDINYSNLADSLYAIQEKYEFEEGSQFLFYFAGHGGFNKYDNTSCLLLRDSKLNSSGTFDNAMTSATLKGLINQIKSTRTMVVIDACHSRKLTDDCKEAECMALDQSKKFDKDVFDSYLKSPGKVIFTSANVFQEASDGDPYQYSPFANAFITSLNERSLKKIEFDSKAVYKDMLNYQADKTKNKLFQSEMKYCSYNESNKDDDRFIFIPK